MFAGKNSIPKQGLQRPTLPKSATLQFNEKQMHSPKLKMKKKQLTVKELTLELAEDYKVLMRSYIKSWKKNQLKAGDMHTVSFDPRTSKVGFVFAEQVKQLCNLFKMNIKTIDSCQAYGNIYDAILNRLESIFNSLDDRIAGKFTYHKNHFSLML